MRTLGLPPRARGSPQPPDPPGDARRSTPASTGDLAERMVGGAPEVGLPPRARGSRGCRRRLLPRGRSTPASTGISGARSLRPRRPRVYPREHTDLTCQSASEPPQRGLPPRARGSLLVPALAALGARSTPAGTGISRRAWASRSPARVYPRGHRDLVPGSVAGAELLCLRPRHGDLSAGSKGCASVPGLPPRTRESLARGDNGGLAARSTPADTGISEEPGGRTAGGRVYPRGHGDLSVSSLSVHQLRGLPPWTRGSPGVGRQDGYCARSTPVNTGISTGSPRRPTCRRVYPRGHGDLMALLPSRWLAIGLPPRTRGSHARRRQRRVRPRSTPADTGISDPREPRSPTVEVYPRGHGDLVPPGPGVLYEDGLPPRTRGSHLPCEPLHHAPGSTPADTGISSASSPSR